MSRMLRKARMDQIYYKMKKMKISKTIHLSWNTHFVVVNIVLFIVNVIINNN